jgi:hypothetical protein
MLFNNVHRQRIPFRSQKLFGAAEGPLAFSKVAFLPSSNTGSLLTGGAGIVALN